MRIPKAVPRKAAAGQPWPPALCAGALALLAFLGIAASVARGAAQAAGAKADEIRILTGRSVVLEHPEDIVRVSVANPEVLDTVAVSTRELVLNGKSAGTTSLIVWSKSGGRELFTVTVELNAEPIQRQINETFAGEKIQLRPGKDTLILTGEVSSAVVAERAAAVAATGAKTVINHLTVQPAGAEKQILLRVKFAEIDRGYLTQYGTNLLSTGALNTPASVTTGQFAAPRVASVKGVIGGTVTGTSTDFTLSDMLNVFAFRPDLNLALLLKALQGRNLLQILAEPNLVTSNGREATFLAGGEFPFPVLQGGGNAGSVTIQFREFGVRVVFLPQLTAHDSIRLHVRPEVSALDYSNALSISGFLIPAISTRRVEVDVELQMGQSFAIAGLLDQRVTDSLQKIPGLANIPLLGSLFKSRSLGKNNSELLVVVTPELAGPASEIRPSSVAVDVPFQAMPGAPAPEARGKKR